MGGLACRARREGGRAVVVIRDRRRRGMDGVGADAVSAFGSRILRESWSGAHIADRDEACRRPVGHPPRDRLRHARFAPSERVGSLRTLAIRVRWDERGTWGTWGSCQCYPALLSQAELNQTRRSSLLSVLEVFYHSLSRHKRASHAKSASNASRSRLAMRPPGAMCFSTADLYQYCAIHRACQ